MLEELDYEKPDGAYSPGGGKSAADPGVLFKVLVFGYMCGMYSGRKLEEACRYRIDFGGWESSGSQYPGPIPHGPVQRNGQLKPSYNMQVAVNSEYITGTELFPNRTDVKTLQPFLKRMEQHHHARYEEVTADAGYESLENYLYLESTGQMCFIKPTNYDTKDSKKFKAQSGRIENMRYDAEEDCYYCEENRRLPLRRENTQLVDGQWRTEAWYRCESCANCPKRALCCRAKDPEQVKMQHVKKDFWELRAQATEDIASPRGHSPETVPFYPGRGRFCAAEE